jgi:hypothetical protein
MRLWGIGVAEKVIIALTVMAVVVLYMGMHASLVAPDPSQPPTINSIHAVIEKSGHKCDAVDSFRRLGSKEGWNYFLARCHDGGRYVFFQNPTQKQFGATSCTEEQAQGYRCPE